MTERAVATMIGTTERVSFADTSYEFGPIKHMDALERLSGYVLKQLKSIILFP